MRLPTFDLFRHRDFARFWAFRFTGTFGFQILAVTLGWQVYEIARTAGRSIEESAFLLGLVGLCQFVPLLILAPFGGQLADRGDRKLILIGCVTGKLVTLAALIACSRLLPGETALPALFVIAGFSGAVNAFAPAAAQSLMPTLVPREVLPKAVAFSSLAFSSGSIIGPALAGAAIAAGQRLGTGGAEAGYATATLFYALALLCLLAVRAPKRAPLTEARSLAMIGEGLAFVWRNKVVLGAMSLDLVAVLLAGATALLPVFARDLLDTGGVPPEVALGWMRSAVALGAALTALVLTAAPLTRRVGAWMFGSVAVFGLATVAFGLADHLWPALVALMVIGASDMVSVNVRSSLIQLATPDPMRGRVASIGFIFISASNELGDFQSGLAARLLGPVGAVLFGGVGALATTLIWIKLFPELWALDSFEDAARLAETDVAKAVDA